MSKNRIPTSNLSERDRVLAKLATRELRSTEVQSMAAFKRWMAAPLASDEAMTAIAERSALVAREGRLRRLVHAA